MKYINILPAAALILSALAGCSVEVPIPSAGDPIPDKSCVILASQTVKADAEWNNVALSLQRSHDAELLYFKDSPRECKSRLIEIQPRYVTVVDLPRNIGPDYIMDANRLSREMDDDIYADYLWGIVTGYDAASALRMADDSTEPLLVRNCVSDIMELESAKWFDRYAWVDDHAKGKAGEKQGPGEPVKTYNFNFDDELETFSNFIYSYEPDLIVTATHADYDNLTVPFMPSGKCKFVSEGGVIYKEYNKQKTEPLKFTAKRKVYFPVGNCLIGGMNNDINSMPPAWIKSARADAMIGYVVPTWYGRNGWGGLKYWLTTPGRYNLSQSIYLNQQDMLAQMDRWDPGFNKAEYPFHLTEEEQEAVATVQKELGRKLSDFDLASYRIKAATSIEKPTIDMIGFLHDRDVLAFYGDPMWDVRLQQIPQENDFTVTQRQRKGRVTLIIRTGKDFSLERMQGGHFKEEHVLDLPFSWFFPTRLQSPALCEGQEWDAVVDENFLLIYNPAFKPDRKYTIRLRTGR